MEKLIYEALCRIFGRDYVDAVLAEESAAKEADSAESEDNDNGR